VNVKWQQFQMRQAIQKIIVEKEIKKEATHRTGILSLINLSKKEVRDIIHFYVPFIFYSKYIQVNFKCD
jgi:hypothetical protein